jgi:hypothetical protein
MTVARRTRRLSVLTGTPEILWHGVDAALAEGMTASQPFHC